MSTTEPTPRTLDDAMQDFIDEYGSQFLRLEGPDIRGNWYAEIIASGVVNAVGIAKTPAAALDEAIGVAREQDETPDTGGKERG